MHTSFESAARQYTPMLLRRAQGWTGNASDAEDVVQNALILAWGGWAAVLETKNIVGCLHRHAFRAFLIWKRDRGRLKRGAGARHVPLEEWTQGVDGAQEATVILGQVRSRLSSRDADDIFRLAKGETLEEIAVSWGVTAERMRQRIKASREKLERPIRHVDVAKLSTKG